jgi:plastocyanin
MTSAPSRQPSGRRRHATRAGATALALAAVVVGATGCSADPAPQPRATGLEVVLDGCRVNLESVPAGAHTVRVVGSGRATVTDPQGAVVLTAPGGEEEPAHLALTKGTYDVTCEPEGGRLGEARLRVR